MSSQAEIREREDRLLVELTDLAMGLARDMAGRAKQAEALEDAERFTLAFDRMSRSVRLSISLRRRLERDEVREETARRSEVVDLKTARLRARLRTEIRETDVSFRVRCELERELDEQLAEDALYERFLDLPFEAAISRLRINLGLPDPPPQGEVDRAQGRETEGGEERAFAEGKGDAIDNDLSIAVTNAHSRLHSLQPPQSAALTAPPEGEHLETASSSPAKRGRGTARPPGPARGRPEDKLRASGGGGEGSAVRVAAPSVTPSAGRATSPVVFATREEREAPA